MCVVGLFFQTFYQHELRTHVMRLFVGYCESNELKCLHNPLKYLKKVYKSDNYKAHSVNNNKFFFI